MLTLDSITKAETLVDRSIMPGDHMYHEKNPTHYFNVGRSAVTCIIEGLQAAGAHDAPAQILDFACGSGRVTRWLKAVFPHSTITCSDLRQDSLEFLRSTLGVNVSMSSPDFAAIHFDRKFDVIWSGSLITHLPEPAIGELLRAVSNWLAPHGIAVLTSHGKEVARRLTTPEQKYVPPAVAAKMLSEYITREFSYIGFQSRPGLGFSISSPQFITDLAEKSGLKCIRIIERGWDNHQDALVFTRT